MRRQGVSGFDDAPDRIAFCSQAEDDSGLDAAVPVLAFLACRDDSEDAHGNRVENPLMLPQIARQVDAEIVERQVGDGYAARKVFKVDYGLLEFEKLLASVFEVIHLVSGLLLDEVLFACRRNVQQDHATADTFFEVDVLLQFDVRPEVHKLDAGIGGTETVDSTESLNDADRVPVDVEIDEVVAVLEVLTFRNAVRGDQEVDFPFSSHVCGSLLRFRSERCQEAR